MTVPQTAIRTRLLGLVLLLLFGWSGLAPAHPVPRSEFDRNLTVTWRTDAVHILYRLEIDEYTLLTTVGNPENGFRLGPKKGLGRRDVADAFIARMKEVIPDNLVCTVNGKQMEVACTDARVDFLDSVQFRFKLRVRAPLNPGRHTLEVEDLNFLEKKGKVVLKFESEDGLKVEKLSEPPEGTAARLLDFEKRTLTATARVEAAEASVPPAESSPLEPLEPDSEPVGFFQLLREVQEHESLAILLDSRVGLWMILLIAALHGVLHSVSPGHGKTMVAAYLVGERGTPRHAVILGLIVTLTHTSAAFAVALLLKFVLPATAAPAVQRGLGMIGGSLVVLIGLWLLMQRLAGRSDHVHLGGHGHSHSHSHAHSHGDGGHAHSHGLSPEDFGRVGWIRLILLGISGGIVPCWGAILWVIYCVTAGRYGLALYAVVAFSIGLASVLILLGLAVVWTSRAGARQYASRRWFDRLSRWLPVVGAAAVMLIGLWLVKINLPK